MTNKAIQAKLITLHDKMENDKSYEVRDVFGKLYLINKKTVTNWIDYFEETTKSKKGFVTQSLRKETIKDILNQANQVWKQLHK